MLSSLDRPWDIYNMINIITCDCIVLVATKNSLAYQDRGHCEISPGFYINRFCFCKLIIIVIVSKSIIIHYVVGLEKHDLWASRVLGGSKVISEKGFSHIFHGSHVLLVTAGRLLDVNEGNINEFRRNNWHELGSQ